MVQKENNILIDETRTDLRQGFQGIHQSSLFVPHLVSCSQSLILLTIQFLKLRKDRYRKARIHQSSSFVPYLVSCLQSLSHFLLFSF